MRILLISILLLLGFWTPIFAQTQADQETLIEFKGKNRPSVSRSAFEYVYQKNNGGYDSARSHDPSKYREYLDLYVTFKRKVIQAQEMGIDTTRAFKGELKTYLKQLAQPYLVKKEVLDELIREAYDHWRQAVSVSHILVRIPEEAGPADTLRAWQRINELRDSLRSGKAFSYIAENYSEDPSAKDNKGFLGFFTAFDFVYPFEKASYDTPVGQVSAPIRTQYGYHLIRVHEKIEAPGNREAAHILVRFGPNYEAKDSTAAYQRILEVQRKLKNGADFAKIAEEYSDDPNSKGKGGKLGNRYLPIAKMQEMKFKLKDKELSDVFQTQFGWHIMTVSVEDANKTFDDLQKVMRNRVTRDKRASIAEDELIAQLKSQYSYQAKMGTFNKMVDNAGKAYQDADFTGQNLPVGLKDETLITFADKKYTIGDYINYLPSIRRRNTEPNAPKPVATTELESFVHSKLLDYEEGQLEQKYPEFRHLKQEYHDGILLFTLTEKMVWRKAVEDTVGLRKFFEKNKSKYTAPDRVRVIEFRSSVEESMEKLDSMLKAGVQSEKIDSALAQELFTIRRSEQILNKDTPRAKTFYGMKAGAFTPIAEENKYFTIYQVDAFLPAGMKSFEEARSEAITDYQSQLEKEWIEDLAKKYKYKLDEAVFAKLFKHP